MYEKVNFFISNNELKKIHAFIYPLCILTITMCGYVKTSDLTIPHSKNRLDGVHISDDDVSKKIIELFTIKNALTPTEIASIINMSREHVSRKFIYPMVKNSMIEKVAGTKGKYRLTGKTTDSKTLTQDNVTKSEFYNKCSTIQNWVNNNSKEHTPKMIAKFCRIVTGNYNPNFRINPDQWRHPTTTIECIKSLREFYNDDKLNYMLRQCLRHFIIYGLGKNLPEEEGILLGISGEKDTANLGDLFMSIEQYKQVKSILVENSEYHYLLFGFGFWTFCRPSVRHCVKLDDLQFYDRELEFVKIKDDDKIITDPERIEDYKMMINLSPHLKDTITIEKRSERACKLRIYEFKTEKFFQKRIYDNDFVNDLEKYVKKRKFLKKKFLFWDNNDTEFKKRNYKQILTNIVGKANEVFVDTFFNVGFKTGDFGKKNRANYAIRHFGLQHWLQMTDYDVSFVAEMSHDDITTLTTWYGKHAGEYLEKKLNRVIFK